MLSTNYRLKLTDICCRIITTNGALHHLGRDGAPVTLEERIWMNKLCEHNLQARELAGAMLCPNTVGEDVNYYH